GWKIDLRSESEAEDEARRARASLLAIPNLSDVTAELLYQNGVTSAEDLAASGEETVGEIEGIGAGRGGTSLAGGTAPADQKPPEKDSLAAVEEDTASEPGLETAPGAAQVLEGGRK